MNIDWRRWCHPALLLLLLLAYVVGYLQHPALPGNNPEYPQGWWGWFDQGQYLKAAWSFSAMNLSPQNYFYPPLYSMLGALFVRLSPLHPFMLIDLFSFIAFAHFFITLARRYIGWIAAALLFGISFLPPLTMSALWIEPWTSTVVAPVFAYLFWRIDRVIAEQRMPENRSLFVAGLLGGFVFATRPVDAVVLVPAFCFLAWLVWRSWQKSNSSFNVLLLRSLSLIGAGMIGISIFCVFNLLVHGSLGGLYFDVSNSNGFHPADIAEKAVSVFLDPIPLYGSEAESVLHKIPWLAIALPGMLFIAVQGPTILRLILGVMATQLLIYLPYADLLPTGFWKYHNVHYFKWMFPYLWLCAAYPLMLLLKEKNRRYAMARYVACAVVGGILLCTKFKLVDISGQASVTRHDGASPHDRVHIVFQSPIELDMIALRTLQGGYTETYFGFFNTVSVDGKGLKPVRDIRFLPAPQGTPGINLLFIRPVTAKTIDIVPQQLNLQDGQPDVRLYRYRFTLGKPAWLQRLQRP